MGLTVEVLNDLEASNLQAASQAALMENNAIALIELLEMLWSCNLEGANTVIDARERMSAEPQVAIQELKLSLENIRRAAELDAPTRAALEGTHE